MFLDTSRNRSRHWCDMKDCGNRAKVSRFRQRQQQRQRRAPSA
jgi:predicted RNA-binding Zn ribbon-like protein